MNLYKSFLFARFLNKQVKVNKDFALEEFLIEQFMQTHRRDFRLAKYSKEEVEEIISYTIDKDYMKYFSRGTIEGGTCLRLTSNGKDLIDIPLGTIQHFGREYGKAFALMIAILISHPVISIVNFLVDEIKHVFV